MKKTIIGVFVLFIINSANAELLSFESVWNKINQSSALQEASRLQTQVYSESQTIASRHWLPRLYLDAKGFQTNDPGASFFGLLEQRSIQQNDFNPTNLNEPDGRFFTRAALGVDLPVYEGGTKSAKLQSLKHSVAAQQNETSQIQIEQYAQVGQSYVSIAILDQQKNKLEELNSEITHLIKNYQLGSKSNPVGYSGLLGMKSLANRLNGLISKCVAQNRSYYAMLSEMGLKDLQWTPAIKDAMAFVNHYFPIRPNSTAIEPSFVIASSMENAKAIEQMEKMEKGKFLPRVGLFAEAYAFNGNRDLANGYNAGIYLQWNLFNPSDYGSGKEARLKSQVASKNTEALYQHERAEWAGLQQSTKSLQENIRLLDESYQILMEQSKITGKLFQNGSINALQIVEILNRRADLIVQQGEAELALAGTASQTITKEKFDITNHISNGASHE
jgi:outer membrane protein TolC